MKYPFIYIDRHKKQHPSTNRPRPNINKKRNLQTPRPKNLKLNILACIYPMYALNRPIHTFP